ncbi:CinA family protein [Thaumasiovibrio sp. DFM-14]|uniref:CinA family protein n=1 Tax=Thaumasiovibrio sp. DFM-14 TaxID=3384792 RepID=UPI0039A295A3
MNKDIVAQAACVGRLLQLNFVTLTTAESCTGGGISAAITEIPGSSAWFERGFVTYSNEAKHAMLGVSLGTLSDHGAVSAAVVAEMAAGACREAKADIGIAVSGIAGPDGGSEDKPVGTVWFGVHDVSGWVHQEQCRFAGERGAVREQAVLHALNLIEQRLKVRH